ncbi:MAG: hypothetical protein M1818_008083 [Claussenomyces sp. TS43310]|nr:MAG: hypothetical protein M1818_008083 [Claussenomyces sp. TS43310]
MSAQVTLDTPLAQRLNDSIQPKLVEIGWSSGGVDDSALSEYIILMLVNGKTQDQIAAELAGDLLNLGPDDPGARDFSQWLFQQVELLNQEENGVTAQAQETVGFGQSEPAIGSQDAEMGEGPDSGEVNVPTGPKSMRGGPDRTRDKRMLGHLGKAMDRSNESVLHRVRPHGGNERINTHARAPPTGPRSNAARGGRAGTGRPNMVPGMPGPATAMSPQQQMELFSMFEQQSRLMASMFTPQQQQMMMGNGGVPGMNGMGGGFPAQQPSGRSLFERVRPNKARGGPHANAGKANGHHAAATPTSPMDMELTPAHEPPSADTTCKFNLSCTNKDCKFAHQSPAAPPGTAIDVTDTCSFGAACKNRKCTARHPSPAQKTAHQVEQDCKFFPNCTNPRCPFRHPTMPLCRNGADCTTPDCKFTHVQTKCKFNPCLNPSCAFKHEEGQKRGKFDDKVWVAGDRGHVSERKFIDEDDAVEELLVPGQSEAEVPQAQTELVT